MTEEDELVNCVIANNILWLTLQTGQILKQVQDDEEPQEIFALFLNFTLLNYNLFNQIK